MNEYPDSKKVARFVEEYFDRMSTTDKNYVMAAITRVLRKLALAGLKQTSSTSPDS